jgi:hypothetical protein
MRSAVRGQVMIIFALASLVLVGFIALSIDTGFLMAERRQVQNAADAAALAAAVSIQDDMNSSNVTAAAVAYAAENAGVSADDVTVNWPPAAGSAYAGDSNYVQVTVNKDVQRFFLGAIYNGPWEVSATAIAGLEPEGFDAAILALNSDAGGINTSGSTSMRAICGSIVSNFEIRTSGSTTIAAQGGTGCPSPLSAYVVANDGFNTSGSTNISGTSGVKPHGAEVPDPLADKIDPPPVPNVPANPIASVSPSNGNCRTYSPWSSPVTYTITSSKYTSGGASCVNIQNIPGGQTMSLQSGNYRFDNGTGITVGGGNGGDIVLQGGTYNFNGSSGGINIGGATPYFEMKSGNYSFNGGTGINIGGSANNNILGGGNFYFGGGSEIHTGGSNKLTIGPGTYIFNGGDGLRMSGSDRLHFSSGDYTMYFANGADLAFSGSSRITFDTGVYVRAHFLGGSGSNWSDLEMSGSTNFALPSGEYIFDHGRFLNSGSSTISGDEVFLYFRNGGYLSSSGSASFGFTAPDSMIYSGYYPGVFMYSDRDNTATFHWTGSTSSVSRGTIYLPSSPVQTAGAATGTQFEGQFIADRFITSGATGLTVRFVEYVQTQIPMIYLVD